MHVFTYSEARNNLKLVLDKVRDDADIALITRKDGNHGVIMSYAQYNSLMETLYLLSSPNNAAHLNKSIIQFHSGQAIKRDLIHE